VRISASRTCAAKYGWETSARLPANRPSGAFELVEVIALKGCQAGVEQFPLGHDNDIEPRRDLVATKNLSNQTFRSVSRDRPAKLARGRDTQPRVRQLVGQQEEREIPAMRPGPAVVNPLEIGADQNPFTAAQAGHGLRQPLAEP